MAIVFTQQPSLNVTFESYCWVENQTLPEIYLNTLKNIISMINSPIDLNIIKTKIHPINVIKLLKGDIPVFTQIMIPNIKAIINEHICLIQNNISISSPLSLK